MFFRELPKHKVAGISKTKIAGPVQAFANITTLPNLATGFVLLFLCSPNFAEM
jgi:hypothetical protein